MSKIKNPFITSGYVSAEFFCDRKRESAELIRSIVNGQNIAMISPRRMGKTGLIEHCFHQQEIENEYHTFFIDIYATGSIKEFVFALGKQIFETLKPKGKKFLDNFFSTITSLRPAFKLDSFTGAPTFDIGIGNIQQPEYSLEQIFNYLESADRRCIVAIDEFQQIEKYPEKNIEALLRTHIQQCKNTNFVLAGSQRHMMQNMFFSASRPFYQSVSVLNLEAITPEKYVPFIQKHLADADKTVTQENILRVYNLFEGHTWYIQNIFNRLYSLTDSGEVCSLETISETIDDTLTSYETIFRGILSLLQERQKELLFAIAKEGKATGMTSALFIKKHGLQSASSVQTSLKQLLDKEIITREENTYQVYDRFLGLWLSKAYGMGYHL
jgi:AAA+ ATPase superfamily predicted ATPase